MNRRRAMLLAAALPAATSLRAQEAKAPRKDDSGREAVLNYHAAQAALYSSLAYAYALEKLADLARSEDMDLARSYVHTINREIQAVNDSSVKVGQGRHELEKTEAMKTLRAELNEASKGIDKAQDAVDGIGILAPSSKNIVAHLANAAIASYKLAEPLGVAPLPPPGGQAFLDWRRGG